MCGRASLTVNEQQLELKFGKDFYSEDLEKYLPIQNYNVAPSHQHPVIKANATHFEFLRWGLVPFWAKDIKIGYRMINARIETLLEKNAYKNAAKSRRCVVPFDGFYEWMKKDGQKIPHRITLKDQGLFLIAGLWESWKSPEGEHIESFTLITRSPIDRIKHLHDRMPAIIIPGEEEAWLDEQISPKEAIDNLRPLGDDELDFYEVSSEVGNVRNNYPELIEKA